MAFCSNCGTELTEGAKFCPNCGNPSESSQAKKEIVSESSSDCSIVLVSAGAATLNVTKALREILGVGLKEAKDIIDSAPCTIMEGLTMSDAKGNAQYLRECGAITAIKQNGKTIHEDTPPHFNTSTQENTIIENDNSEEGLSKWEKVALGVAGFVAFTGICGGVADGMWIVVLLSLCAMGAICAVFMGTIEKKYAWTTAIVSFLVVCSAIGASAPDEKEENQTQTEQKQESPEEKQAREKKEQANREANEKQEKIKKVAEMAYNLGYETRKKTWGETLSSETAAEADYRFRYGKDPEDEGQSERWKVFLENYQKGFSDCAHDIVNKFKQEDF